MPELTKLEIELEELLLDTDSRTLPELPNKKDKTNWVEKAGGLPSYINRIAKHLHTEKGMDVSRAIAVAVNTVKRWCSSGQTSEGGKSGVSAKTKALACKAVSEWEAKKAKSHLSQGKPRLVAFEGLMCTEDERDLILSIAAQIEATADMADDFDMDAFHLALDNQRSELNLATVRGVILFDPKAHPRDWRGRFQRAVHGLKPGETLKLPDGVRVTRRDPSAKSAFGRFTVSGGEAGDHGQGAQFFQDASKAADVALDRSAGHSHDDALGGAWQHNDAVAVEHQQQVAQDMTDEINGWISDLPRNWTNEHDFQTALENKLQDLQQRHDPNGDLGIEEQTPSGFLFSDGSELTVDERGAELSRQRARSHEVVPEPGPSESGLRITSSAKPSNDMQRRGLQNALDDILNHGGSGNTVVHQGSDPSVLMVTNHTADRKYLVHEGGYVERWDSKNEKWVEL